MHHMDKLKKKKAFSLHFSVLILLDLFIAIEGTIFIP